MPTFTYTVRTPAGATQRDRIDAALLKGPVFGGVVEKVADFYDDEVHHAVEALTSLLEPLLMVVLGVRIGFMLIAMYLPIFEMAGALD